MPGRRYAVAASLLLLAALLVLGAAAEDDSPFEHRAISGVGRTVMAEMADFDGDERTDLVTVSVRGIPPNETRTLRVYLQAASGGWPEEPSFQRPLPAGAAAYDLGDLRPEPGTELVLLRQGGITLMSLAARDAPRVDLDIPGRGTIGAAVDERGLERLQLVRPELGSPPWLLVPRLTDLVVLDPLGEQQARLEVGARANYFVPRQPGIMFVESDIQLFLDAPRVLLGDVQGDGHADIVTASRHEMKVFLRRTGETEAAFPEQPDHSISLGLLSERDHIRGSGGVSIHLGHFDGDGLADLLVSHVAGSFADAHSLVRAYRNLGGRWDLSDPLSTHESEGTLGTDILTDVDGDGRVELVRGGIPFSVLEFVEALVTRSIDANLEVYRLKEGGGFAAEPVASVKLGIPISFDTFRTAGFVPTLQSDLNADGFLDLLTSGEGDKIEVFLGAKERSWSKRSARQDFDSEGQLRLADVDGDGLQDLLVFDPMREAAPLHLMLNRGLLPGIPPKMSAAP